MPVLPRRAGHLLKPGVFRTDEVMVLEDPGSKGMTSDELVASLRQIDGQRAKGKHPPNSHYRSKPFLHFHNGPDRTYADVRFGGDFEPVTASTPKQREVLLEQAHVTAELASRQRKRG